MAGHSPEKGEYAGGMKVKANALGLSGYRLPAEAEWELACRAGSVTRWSMGEAEDLLGKYAWYIANSPSRSRPAGLLRPNDLGLFDLHGNALEWCQNRYEEFTDMRDRNIDDKVDNKSGRAIRESYRALRGGAYHDYPWNVRSAFRAISGPEICNYFGFRPARTFP